MIINFLDALELMKLNYGNINPHKKILIVKIETSTKIVFIPYQREVINFFNLTKNCWAETKKLIISVKQYMLDYDEPKIITTGK